MGDQDCDQDLGPVPMVLLVVVVRVSLHGCLLGTPVNVLTEAVAAGEYQVAESLQARLVHDVGVEVKNNGLTDSDLKAIRPERFSAGEDRARLWIRHFNVNVGVGVSLV